MSAFACIYCSHKSATSDEAPCSSSMCSTALNKQVVQPLLQFVNNSTQLLRTCHKPDQKGAYLQQAARLGGSPDPHCAFAHSCRVHESPDGNGYRLLDHGRCRVRGEAVAHPREQHVGGRISAQCNFFCVRRVFAALIWPDACDDTLSDWLCVPRARAASAALPHDHTAWQESWQSMWDDCPRVAPLMLVPARPMPMLVPVCTAVVHPHAAAASTAVHVAGVNAANNYG